MNCSLKKLEMIETLFIENYKSIDSLGLDCARINVFVGEPNVGKSNILEALDLSYLPRMSILNRDKGENTQSGIDIKKYFRVNKVADLFHAGNISKAISIRHPEFSAALHLEYLVKKDGNGSFELKSMGSMGVFNNEFEPVKLSILHGSPIIPYKYNNDTHFHDKENYLDKLMPPFGNNLGNVIRYNKDMQELLKDFAEDNNFEVNINTSSYELAIQLRINEGLVYELPYAALGDTNECYFI